MNRLPFDPGKAHGSPAPEPSLPAQPARPLSVSQLSELIKTTLEQKLPSSLKVVGEVSNFGGNQHWFFSLKDEAAVLNCVAWATSARRIRYKPKDGDEVVATGHISHFGPQGRTQLYVSDLQPVGAGALELKFRAMCEELRGLGYFAETRKKPLPLLPRRIAVITSATGAAVQDVINTAAQRCKATGLLIVDVRVQGEGAASEIARAIRWVDRHRNALGVDGLLVTRGGGSIEDLWAFNERIVADAVFTCTLPVVAAIGHESDTTIIELVADVRASTPTQAAMKLVPSATELCAQIKHTAHRIGALFARNLERQRERAGRSQRELLRSLTARFSNERARLAQLSAHLSQLDPTRLLAQRHSRLAVLRDRLHRAMVQRIDLRDHVSRMQLASRATVLHRVQRSRAQVMHLQRHLEAIDPLAVLRRGYSITVKATGEVVRSVQQVHPGDRLATRVADGLVESTVTPDPAATEGSAQTKNPRARKRASARCSPADQLDLFRAPE